MTPEQNEMFIGYSAAFHEFCHHNLSPILGTLCVRRPSAALNATATKNSIHFVLRALQRPVQCACTSRNPGTVTKILTKRLTLHHTHTHTHTLKCFVYNCEGLVE